MTHDDIKEKKSRRWSGHPATFEDSSRHTRCASVDIEDCGFDDSERLTLELIRYFCLHYAAPYTQGNTQALPRAQSLLGTEQGMILSEIISDLIETVRRARTSPFYFGDPRCQKCVLRVFPTELAAMSLIRAARQGEGEKMRQAAQDLVEDSDPTKTLLAGHRVGTHLDTIFLDGLTGRNSKILH